MTDSRLARRPDGAVRVFGDLPPSTTRMTAERAQELAGVDGTEIALLASTTFKEARSLEELVTLIATTRRRGLDGLLRHVYYERFGGQNSDPSMHVGIDGLRAIAAATGEYGGGGEPHFAGVWDMPMSDNGNATRPVPEQCRVTVWRIVKGRSCAFEGMAYMEEAYPGAGGRGRMWRARPRGMLAIAAERQALRRAFPSETSGLGDIDDVDEQIDDVPPATPTRTVSERSAEYGRIFNEDKPPPRRERPLGDLIDYYNARLGEAVRSRLVGEAEYQGWRLPESATRETVVEYGTRLNEVFNPAEVDPEVDRALADNAALISDAADAGAVVLKAHRAQKGWPLERIVAANDELLARVQERNAQLDDQAAHEQEQLPV